MSYSVQRAEYSCPFVFKYIFSPPRFIEYGEYKDNQYGTSLESIRSVLARNKLCLVDVQPEVSSAQVKARQEEVYYCSWLHVFAPVSLAVPMLMP